MTDTLETQQNLGEILQAKREELSITKDFIATKLNLKEREITAIENNEFQQISKNVYLSGLLSEYAKIIEVDCKIIAKEFSNLSKGDIKKESKINVSQEFNHSPKKDTFILSLSLSIIISFILLFYYNYTIKTNNNTVYNIIKNYELK